MDEATRYVPEQLPADERGRIMWGLRDLTAGRLVADPDGEVEHWLLRDSAVAFAGMLRGLDSVRPS